MTTKQDVWLAVYRDALKAQRKEHPMDGEPEWAIEAAKEADMAADAFLRKFPHVIDNVELP